MNKLRFSIKLIKNILILLVVGLISSSLIDYTFSASTTDNPNVNISINNDGTISQSGNLFNGQLYPSTEKDAEKGIGGISGVIRINNKFRNIEVTNLSIGLNNIIINNKYPKDIVENSFLQNIRLKIEKGQLLVFNKTIVDYTSLNNLLYKTDSNQYKGYNLSNSQKFIINKGEIIDLRYTLHMVEETGNELQSVTAQMPIYINLMGVYETDDDDDDGIEVVIIEDNEIPVGKLNKDDHFQYIQGYPNNTVKPEGLITREEVAAVFYRLLDADYRISILSNIEYFNDVKHNRWSLKHIATLYKGAIIEGYPDKSFKPKNAITRAELAAIVSRFDKLSITDENKFTDIENHWARQYINSASEKGWVNGYPDGTFKPNNYITRAEFVTLVNNVLERKIHKDNILAGIKMFSDLDENMWYYEAMVEAINSHIYLRDENKNELWLQIIYPELDL